MQFKLNRCVSIAARTIVLTNYNTYAASYVQASSIQAGSAAAAAEVKKSQKYADIIAGVDFVPFAIETSGVWGEQALDLVKEVGRRIAALTHEPRSTAFLRQRISVAVQRGNAYCVLGTLKAANTGPQPL